MFPVGKLCYHLYMLDNKECFEYWVEIGTLRKVAMVFEREGRINPLTDRPYTFIAVWMAAYKWVLENPDEAWKIYQEKGSPLSKEQWEKFLTAKAAYIFKERPNYFKEWLLENKFEKYEEMYERYHPKLLQS